jgi:hypothetical protein
MWLYIYIFYLVVFLTYCTFKLAVRFNWGLALLDHVPSYVQYMYKNMYLTICIYYFVMIKLIKLN